MVQTKVQDVALMKLNHIMKSNLHDPIKSWFSEDLTLSNSKLVSDAYKHEHCKSTWSVNGKCFGLLVNKQIVRFRVGDNVNHVIRDGMQAVTAAGSEPDRGTPGNANIESNDENKMVVEVQVHAEHGQHSEIDWLLIDCSLTYML